MRATSFILTAAILLSACASEKPNVSSAVGETVDPNAGYGSEGGPLVRPDGAPVSINTQQDPDGSSEEREAQISHELTMTIDMCRSVLINMDKQSKFGALTSGNILVLGLISGAVIAPALTAANAAANAGWIAGASGLGGISAIASQNVESLGLGASGVITQRNQIVDRFREQISVALDSGNSPRTRRNAIKAAAVECLIYKAFQPALTVP